jgi:hypothetical protein
MIGENHFEVVIDGLSYKLRTGARIDFLSRENIGGVTNEELIGVLLHRLKYQGKQQADKCTSRAITKLEEAQECLWRRDIERGNRHSQMAAQDKV